MAMSNTLSKSPTMTKSKTHPGGVQGALSRFWYHSDETPFPVNKPPTANAAKLRSKKSKVGIRFFDKGVFLKLLNKRLFILRRAAFRIWYSHNKLNRV
jgi:hypothetical protein